MNPRFLRSWRAGCWAVYSICFCILTFQAVQRTTWYKDRLYNQLLTGTSNQRLAAATGLARVGAEEHLLSGLKSPVPEVRELSRRALEHTWFVAAGRKAFAMTEEAYQAMEAEDYSGALELLNDLVAQYPEYAEGWNRRASLLWQIGEYERAIADCERALVLNPHHYGAWQGIGVCQLQMGDIAAACRSLRAALRIHPHDEATRSSLRRCEELLRIYPSPITHLQDYQLL